MSDHTPNPAAAVPTVPEPPAPASAETATAVGIGSAAPIDAAVTLDVGDPAGRTAPPDIPGYQVECELGRGGMGVVYKARHLHLNRPVAIKMILGGRYADPAPRRGPSGNDYALARRRR